MRRHNRIGGSAMRSASPRLGAGRGGAGGSSTIAALFQSVNASGWSSTYASPPTFNPSGSPEYFTVSRQGYVGKTATTITENMVCTQRIRQAYPSQASLTTDQVALSDYIYSTDTVTGATNNSTETSPKPVANWALPDRSVIGNTLTAEVVAFHRNARNGEQVAAVEFIATDGTTTVSQVVTQSVVSGRTGDRFPVIVYRCSLDVSTLANPATITLNAKVYPHIGGAASVLDSTASSVAREFSPRFYRRDTSLAAAPIYAYVSTSGNDTTGAVSATAATAEASPCATIAGAINRIIAVSGQVDGHVIRLMAGTHVFSTSAIVTTRAQNAAQLIVTRDPNATKATAIMQFGATAATRPRLGASGGWMTFQGITISRQGTFSISGEAASPLRIWFDDLDFDNNTVNAAIYSSSDGFFTGVSFLNGSGSSLFGAATREHRMFRGISVTLGGQSIEGWLILGSDITTPGNLARGTRSYSGAIFAYNRFASPASATPLSDFGASQDVNGLAFVQNVIEYTSATSAHTLRVSGDSATGNNTHVIIHHNTFAGFFTNGRANLFYEDGATARTSKLMSVRGNIHVQINTKGDVFVTNGARVGNWAYLYGVGCEGEFSQFIDADSGGIGSYFAQAYPGLGAKIGTSNSVRNDPLFVDYEGTTSGPTAGAGGGNYALQSGSPAKSRARAVLRYDLAGVERTATTSAGAYQ